MPLIKTKYEKEVVPALMTEFGYKNVMQAPRMQKIVLNMGMGQAVLNVKLIDVAVAEISTITGQKAMVTKAKKSIATYKLRKGMPIGAMVTLRGDRMWEFFERLVNVALPRVRDFRGVSPKAFDGRGNYSLGLREQIVFPEINYDKVERIQGMNVTINTTAGADEQARSMLKMLGVPFRKN